MKIQKILLVFVALLTFSTSAIAAQKIMRLADWFPPTGPLNTIVFEKLKNDIEKATDGRVSLKVEYGMGSPKDLFNMVEDGVIDAAWSANGYMAGRFTLTEFAEFPVNIKQRKGSDTLSVVALRVYNKYFKDSGEYEGLYHAGFWVTPPYQIFSRKPINSLADLKGLKLRVPGGILTEVGKELGIVGVKVPSPKIYEVMQQGVADGVALPYMLAKPYKFEEVAPYAHVMNMSHTITSFVISEKFLDSLSTKDREAVKAQVGEKFFGYWDEVWQNVDDQNMFYFGARAKIIDNPTMRAEYKKKTQGIADKWVKKASKRHPDAGKALAEFQRIMNK